MPCGKWPVSRCRAVKAEDSFTTILQDLHSRDSKVQASPASSAGLEANSDVWCALQELASDVVDKLQGTSIYLVGMMGSGKSTVGRWGSSVCVEHQC